MKIAFYKRKHHWYDALVRWWTRGPYSHVELAFHVGDDVHLCWSSSPRDGGVRSKLMPLPKEHWDVLEIGQDKRRATVLLWFKDRQGARYDWLGLLGFVMRRVKGRSSRYFCSEAVGAALGYDEAWRFDPNTLHAVVTRRPPVL